MILEEETFKRYGYYPKDLSYGSGKRILAKCDKCGTIREINKNAYRDLCHPCSQKERLKLPESNPMYEKHHTKEAKVKIGDAHRGKILSDKTKQKMSDVCIERFEDPEKHPMYGKHHSKETKQKMRDSHPDNSGINNPNWQGGKSYEPYCIKFDNEFKERVREYFNRRCYICGKNEKDNKARLSIHHVTYNKDTCCDKSIPLFVPLCKSCHMHTNTNREFWQEFFEVSLSCLTNNKCYLTKKEMNNLKNEFKRKNL